LSLPAASALMTLAERIEDTRRAVEAGKRWKGRESESSPQYQ
jgi:hypothetical protein